MSEISRTPKDIAFDRPEHYLRHLRDENVSLGREIESLQAEYLLAEENRNRGFSPDAKNKNTLTWDRRMRRLQERIIKLGYRRQKLQDHLDELGENLSAAATKNLTEIQIREASRRQAAETKKSPRTPMN